jgi:biotin carboxylase
MNYIIVSPNFPSNFIPFTVELKKKGVNTLGIGEDPYDSLHSSLKAALTEYYRVESMDDYDQLLRACAFLTHKYGKIDRIESHNEHWLEMDARLRTDFNVPGLKVEDMARIKRKSGMKKVFKKAGLLVAPGAVVHNLDDALKFIKKNRYPVIVKPDSGVGASGTRKINNREELEAFMAQKDTSDYFMEAFITGNIYSFDGLTDQNGNIVFQSSLVYGAGVMEAVNDGLDMSFYIPRTLPEKIVESGKKAIEAFNLKERFFHLELFLTPDEEVFALELNSRPPGGKIVDMFNYANNINIFEQYAKVVTENQFDAEVSRPYHCYYLGRKNKFVYTHTIKEVLSQYPTQIVHHSAVEGIFSAAIGDYGFIVRTSDHEEGMEIGRYIMDKKQ